MTILRINLDRSNVHLDLETPNYVVVVRLHPSPVFRKKQVNGSWITVGNLARSISEG